MNNFSLILINMKHSLRKISQSVSNFIEKTHEILQDPQNQPIICWSSKGTSFLIRDVKSFETLILPKYFKHSNFSSFVRQLNMYNFHKVRGDKHQNQFQHERFKRGHSQLLSKIKRKQNEIPNMSMLTLEKQNNLINESLQSIEKDLENNQSKDEQHGKQSSQTDTLKLNLEQLQIQNKMLRKNKLKQLNYLKSLNAADIGSISQKFYKFIVSLFTEKIKNQFNIIDSKNDLDQSKKWPNNFDQLIEHIVSSQQPFSFDWYQSSARIILKKHTDQYFMLQKDRKQIE